MHPSKRLLDPGIRKEMEGKMEEKKEQKRRTKKMAFQKGGFYTSLFSGVFLFSIQFFVNWRYRCQLRTLFSS